MQVALNYEGEDPRHRKLGERAEVCAERDEFSDLRLLVPPEQDALAPENVGQDEIHRVSPPRASPQTHRP